MQVPPYVGVMQDHCDQVVSAVSINKHSTCQEHPDETFSLGHHWLFRTLLVASVGTLYWDLASADKTARDPDQKQPLRRCWNVYRTRLMLILSKSTMSPPLNGNHATEFWAGTGRSDRDRSFNSSPAGKHRPGLGFNTGTHAKGVSLSVRLAMTAKAS